MNIIIDVFSFSCRPTVYCNVYLTVLKGKVYSENNGSFVGNYFVENYLNKCLKTC